MQNQGIVLRPAFGFENLCHGGGIESVRTEAVDRLGGQGNQFAPADQFRRDFGSYGIGMLKQQCHVCASFLRSRSA